MDSMNEVFDVVAVIPKCIKSAKDLYDLRERYKDASVLITAIYSESMVIAACLSQIHNLLQRDALNSKKSELHDTLEKAVAGCKAVYESLEHEVSVLGPKASHGSLRFVDRTKVMLKEETLKELLQQIRGQQSALSLLIQGLQMESISDIRRLVHENSVALEQVVQRSNTPQISYIQPSIPDSSSNTTLVSHSGYGQQTPRVVSQGSVVDSRTSPQTAPTGNGLEVHHDLLESLEQNMLPFMPPPRGTTPVGDRNQSPSALDCETKDIFMSSSLASATATVSQEEMEAHAVEEKPPPLPPRPSMLHTPNQTVVNHGYDLSAAPSALSVATPQIVMAPSVESTPRITPDLCENVKMSSIWTSLLEEELVFMDRMGSFNAQFYEPIVKQSPNLANRLDIKGIIDQLVEKHRQYVLGPLVEMTSGTLTSTPYAALLESWVYQTQQVYHEYCRQLLRTESVIRMIQATNPQFLFMQDALNVNDSWSGQNWEERMRLPICQLSVYTSKLRAALEMTSSSGYGNTASQYADISRSLHVVRTLRSQCCKVIDDEQNRDQVLGLQRRLQVRDMEVLNSLDLMNPGRHLIAQGRVALKVNGHGPWLSVHAMLLDNYFLWAKDHSSSMSKLMNSKSSDGQLWVTDIPISRGYLQITIPEQQGLYATAGSFEDIPKGTLLYQIYVKNIASHLKPHILGAYSPGDHQAWWQHLRSSGLPVSAPNTPSILEQPKPQSLFDKHVVNRLPSSNNLRRLL
ncbi:hypothetical protein P154DRAFT_494696 [Amniculicola lignicola CBS 123094]|uniref:DH domain-containing protein n=1 Tax=Amniculicola lignicola CBS 123094 TaxID=1392246 RepID=A0A6A5WDH4_9PLEO|nr:hypothetical protein P154DRAFT_494696 [Amniculicola lignicola CBS 123094]